MGESDAAGVSGTLDDEVLAELREDMEEEFGEVIDAFLEEVPDWLNSMRTAVVGRDAETLFQTAHALKSSSGYMGAPVMQSLAGDLERRGRQGEVDDDCADLLARLEAEYAAVGPRLAALARS